MKINWEPISESGDHMTIEEWLSGVECGGFIDYDGFGELATKDMVSDVIIYPSDVTEGERVIDPQFTHIVWYNR